MTYGVYTEDLRYVSISEVGFHTAKKYLCKGSVVCSEKRVTIGLKIEIYFHGWRGFRFFRFDDSITIGFVSLSRRLVKCTRADKVVLRWDGKEGGEA